MGIVELKILKFYKNIESTIALTNNNFVEQEIKKFKSLFDKIEDNPLTLAQRKAIVTDEDSTLVVAGAGTGKTKVLGKLKKLGGQVIDLEELANHRGSIFGSRSSRQPSQKEFESRIAKLLEKFSKNHHFHQNHQY